MVAYSESVNISYNHDFKKVLLGIFEKCLFLTINLSSPLAVKLEKVNYNQLND